MHVTDTIVILDEPTPCLGCRRVLRPARSLDDDDPGDGFYRAADGTVPWCVVCHVSRVRLSAAPRPEIAD